MSITIVDTPGDPTANSYVNLAAAKAYMANRSGADAWLDADGDDARSQALITATARLEQLQYVGARASDVQELKWPRTGVTDPGEGREFDATSVPRPVQYATFELALFILSKTGEDAFGASGLNQFERIKAGSVELTVRDTGLAGELPHNVQRWLRGIALTDVEDVTKEQLSVQRYGVSRLRRS